jgi:hypothetical protein
MTDLDRAEKDADRTFWYGQVGTAVLPCSMDAPPKVVSTQKKHWIEIALVDETGNPVAGQGYKIRLADGTEMTGNLDSRGLARVEGIDPGTCKVTFPDLDQRSWNRYSAKK